MKLDDIYALWEKDSKIDEGAIDTEALRISELHNKYFRLYMQERFSLLSLESEYKKLWKLKYDYYDGSMDEDTLKENNWKPWLRNTLKANIVTHIEADQDIINLSLKIGFQKEKTSFLDSIIKIIQNRGYLLKTALEFRRFQNGGY